MAKDDVGRAKDVCVKLPPKEFVYGKSELKDEAGVAHLTSNWMSKVDSKTKD